MKVKICGITNREDAMVAWESGADAIGFVLYQKSPRYINSSAIKRIVSGLPPFLLTVGVFVNEERQVVQQVMNECGLVVAQLHGEETPDYCTSLQRSILKGMRLRDRGTLLALAEYRGQADIRGFVVDSFSETVYGGTGKTTDWSLAAEIAKTVPILLSGGLTPDNVQEAITQVRPYGVDVSSGVEISPGKKDHDKIRAFTRAAKQTCLLTN